MIYNGMMFGKINRVVPIFVSDATPPDDAVMPCPNDTVVPLPKNLV